MENVRHRARVKKESEERIEYLRDEKGEEEKRRENHEMDR